MKQQPTQRSVLSVVTGMGGPLFWGAGACVGFYVLVHLKVIDHPLVARYFAGHPVEYIETAMFLVGLAALVLKALDTAGQYLTLGQQRLEHESEEPWPGSAAPAMLQQLTAQPASLKNSYLGRRLIDALTFVTRKGSAEGLDDELKYLADADAARQQEGYSLVRIITWATPMLGFLGTVIGITLALGDLSPELLVNSPKDAMDGLLSGLSIAFDTTALALSLSILLMFLQFLVDRVETQLLATVDQKVSGEIVGRFQEFGGQGDPQVAAVERMSHSVMHATEKLVKQQIQLWQETIDGAHMQWSRLLGDSSQQIQSSLTTALSASLREHAERLSENETAASEALARRWEQWQVALSENARLLHSQQAEMARQAEILQEVVEATGDVVKLETALNDNLQRLAGAKNFEDTVMSLSAAIHLLNTKLGAGDGRKVELGNKSGSRDRAA